MDDLQPLASPLLDHCPEGLPARAYLDDDWFQREMAVLFGREWVSVGREEDFAPLTLTRRRVAGVEVIVVAAADGTLCAFHNTCRHRGAALCLKAQEPFNGRLLRCPYHDWAYDTAGRLISTAFARPTPDFEPAEHGLFPVALKHWNGFVFLCLADAPPDFSPDPGLAALDNWPMRDLRRGHHLQMDLACNWKVFWENYNECLHCPGIHPGLSDLVPVYRQGVMSDPERADWQPGDAVRPALKAGARSWTVNGQPCGPEFPGLTEEERAAGHNFVTIYPSLFMSAHVDYLRVVRVEPLSAERTRLHADWLFDPATMALPGFDLRNVTDFATRVLEEDGQACEINQAGLRSPGFTARLMPEEFDIRRFHLWVMDRLDCAAGEGGR